MRKSLRVFFYFSIWITLALVAVVLNILNIDWSQTNIANGVFIVLILSIIQGSVFEFPVQTIATLIVGGDRRENKKAPADRLTIVLNYNLLATSKDDIDECFETMYEAFVGNIGPNVSAVLVSATNDEELKKYELEKRDTTRAIIYDELFREGVSFSQGDYESMDTQRLKAVWQMYENLDPTVFVREYLDDICDKYAREFMVLHRVSRVVRKCGQYQDLMLLSEGESEAYSYCDPEYYGTKARPYGQPLFHASDDVNNIFERKFDYTLVLDDDTGVPRGAVTELLQIAAANPDRGIIQPAIKLHCKSNDTIFMHLESMRQGIFEPMTNAITALLGQSGFFGKGLIKNRVYIDKVIGTKDRLIERVPVDVLSHDTFEAAILQPLYAGSVYLLEAPSYNYITWNIRERRWNSGEILLAMYFWPNAFGRPMRFLQKIFQRKSLKRTKVRTPSKLDFVSSYIAHSALRQMFMKPLLLLYIILHINIQLRYQYASIIIVMFIVLIFPKFATCNRKNYKGVLFETISSICQFTPEALVGTVRICRSWAANISPNIKWIPQRSVEEDFKNSNPFISSLKHLWGYSLLALIASILVGLFFKEAILIFFMFGTLFLLPFFTGFTSLSPNFKCSCRRQTHDMYRENITDGLQAISTGGIYRSLGTLTGRPFKYNPLLCNESK
ncbi:hypothetical protein ACJMK2_005018 [Sinanodonta woodiana]|uniref:Glycosyltransferase 2-like domain-containing protein n=1 Tax=Sinanodonta woodiana TaxID=1069815 RepID=A0ABD3VQC6_SINWO